MAYEFNFPVIMTAAGPQPTALATLDGQLESNAEANSPGISTNLPGSLIDDILGTQVAGLQMYDQARVESINALSPNGANIYALSLLAAANGVAPQGAPTNTSVGVVFTATGSTPAGTTVPQGLQVSDGTHTYVTQSGGIIGSSGSSGIITAFALEAGSWQVPIGTVTAILSQLPTGVTLSLTNPSVGIPGADAETPYSFRTRVLQGSQASPVGSPTLIKKLLTNVPGVQPNLVSVQQTTGGLRVICGGGDNYQMAYAAFLGAGNPAILQPNAAGGTTITVSVYDYPDTYSVQFVQPLAQTVTLSISWNTTLTSFTGGAAFPSLVQQPLASYIQSLTPGSGINLNYIETLFAELVAGLLDPQLLTTFSVTVYINGNSTPPASGTEVVTGNAEGYYICAPTGITVTQA